MMNTDESFDGGSRVERAEPGTAPSISERVVEAVAETLNADVTDLERLYSIVDPDALDALFAPTRRGSRGDGEGTAKVTFTMAECRVVVDDAGGVEVTPPAVAEREPVTSERAAGERPAGPTSE